MNTPLQVLIIEDSEDDALLLQRELRHGGYDPFIERVETSAAMVEALASRAWDIVISDYIMPRFSGLAALRVLQDRGLDLPFIIVSGKIGDTTAVEVMKAGAHDYIAKDKLALLPPIVDRELREAAGRCEQRQTEEALKASEANYQAIFDAANDAVLVHDLETGRIVDANRRALDMFGYTLEEMRELGIWRLNSGEPPFTRGNALLWVRRTLQGEPQLVEWKVKDKEGYPLWVEISLKRAAIGGRDRLLAVVRDITERKQAEETIRHLSFHDTLTGLPNRMLVRDRLDMALALARRSQQMLAVMFLDLDRFKTINDTLGHATGDRLLQAVAERLNGCMREVDTLARSGGDEYIALLPQIQHAEDVAKIARRVFDSFMVPFEFDDHQLYVTTSVGVAIYPYDGKDTESLLKNADAAMYRAKEQGRGNCQFYTPEMSARAYERLKLEGDLRRALEKGEFLLHYQPQVEIDTGRITGMEALVRWQGPDGVMVPPGEFIPLAEEAGLINSIGKWVLRTACEQNRAWQDQGIPPLRVAVNLSARQIHHDLPTLVAGMLQETGLAPQHLELEITESVVMQNAALAVTVLDELRALGVRITMDDFGTGYSSLGYLKEFPISTVKIDRSFIRGLTTDRNDAAIATAIIAMAHSLDLAVVAEGVETAEQLACLKQQHCDQVQGFFFSPPVTADAFGKMIAGTALLA